MIPEVTEVATSVQQQQQQELQLGVATRAGFDGLSNWEGTLIIRKTQCGGREPSSV